MRVTRLAVNWPAPLRAAWSSSLGPGLNLITGDNGAGKTSLLEALHLMAYGRSFRGRVRDGLVRGGRRGAGGFRRMARRRERPAAPRRPAAYRPGWAGRLDGGQCRPELGELCAALAVVSFEPGSHALVTGGGEAAAALRGLGLVPRGTRLPAALAPLCARPEAAQCLAEVRRRRRPAGRLGPRTG